MDDRLLDITGSTKFLGFHLDQKLTWEGHIESVCSKVASGVFAYAALGGNAHLKC